MSFGVWRDGSKCGFSLLGRRQVHGVERWVVLSDLADGGSVFRYLGL